MAYNRKWFIRQYGKKQGVKAWKQYQDMISPGFQRRYVEINDGVASSPSSGGGGGGGGATSSRRRRYHEHPTGRTDLMDPIRNFRFRVEIRPYTLGGWAEDAFPAYIGFTSVSGMSMTMTSIPLQEGGLNTITHQIPGLASYSPITFQKGVFLGDEENWQWLRRLVGTVGNAGYGAPGGNFRCAVRIDILSHPNPGSRAVGGGSSTKRREGYYDGLEFGTEVNDDHATMSILLSKAWITTLAYSDLNAGDSALVVEQMTLVHEGMHVDWAEGSNKEGSADAFDQYFK